MLGPWDQEESSTSECGPGGEKETESQPGGRGWMAQGFMNLVKDFGFHPVIQVVWVDYKF